MPDPEHFRKLERMYLSAPVNGALRPTIEVREGSAEIGLVVGAAHHHAAGAVHGSLYFKAMDDAAFFAVNSVIEDVFVLTVSFEVHLLRPVVSGRLTARGTLVHRSRRLYVAEADLTDDRGRRIGRGSGTFLPGRAALGPDVGYR